MIPLKAEIDISSQNEKPWETYHMKDSIIQGRIDDIEAIKQAIYKILMTERYDYVIYDRNYGIELKDLIGRDRHYVCAVLKERVEDALLYDSRIKGIKDWSVTMGKNHITAEFTVETVRGSVEISGDFDI